MSHSDDHPFPHATWLDIPLGIRAYLITLLNSTLSYTIIPYSPASFRPLTFLVN